MVDKVIEVMRREWESLRYSFRMCGDIGEFNPEDFGISGWLLEQESKWLISNVIEMDKKLPQYGYATPEALNVFTVLAGKAVEKLGLEKELASAFGMSYGSVRTGLITHHKMEPTQILFYKMFYPLGVRFNWDFDPSLVRTKLKIVFERFRSWQNNPQVYVQDFSQFQNIGKAWKEWEELNE